LDYPWESCITLSHDWGWVPNAPYKSPQTVVNLLAEICAKGGCFLLGVGPTADGIIEQPIVERLHEVGNWLRQNGQAIYNTRITPHYNDGKVWFTADKDGETLYAIYTVADGETVPETIEWTVNIPKGKVKVLNINKNVKTKVKDGKVIVTLPKGLKNEPIAMQFKIKK
jgi:alpha-L-fucosidase